MVYTPSGTRTPPPLRPSHAWLTLVVPPVKVRTIAFALSRISMVHDWNVPSGWPGNAGSPTVLVMVADVGVVRPVRFGEISCGAAGVVAVGLISSTTITTGSEVSVLP